MAERGEHNRESRFGKGSNGEIPGKKYLRDLLRAHVPDAVPLAIPDRRKQQANDQPRGHTRTIASGITRWDPE